MRLNIFKRKALPFWPAIWRVTFKISFITFVILFILEYIEPGFVTNWFNPVWLLIMAIITSILVATSKPYD